MLIVKFCHCGHVYLHYNVHVHVHVPEVIS